MDNALLTAGAACIIGAIVGGGLKAFGLELPVLQSRVRQAALAAVGVILVVLAQPLPLFQTASPQSTPATVGTVPPPSVATPVARAPIAATALTGTTVTVAGVTAAGTRVTFGGPPVSVRTTTAGQHVRLGFEGKANQAVTVVIRDPNAPSPNATSLGCNGSQTEILAPGEQSLGGKVGCGSILGKRLPVDGLYIVDLTTKQQLPSDFVVWLYDASPQTGAITIDGPLVPVRTTAPGQHIRLTFEGKANQAVTVVIRDPNAPSPNATSLGCNGSQTEILAPGEQSLGGKVGCGSILGKHLPVDGMYIVDLTTNEELPSEFLIQLQAA